MIIGLSDLFCDVAADVTTKLAVAVCAGLQVLPGVLSIVAEMTRGDQSTTGHDNATSDWGDDHVSEPDYGHECCMRLYQ